jgi:mediator of RNA polymerase II transcription subunit 28
MSNSNGKGKPTENPVERFEQAFQACFVGITKEDKLTHLDGDEIKNDADETINALMDSARAMEGYFLKKRLHIATHRPELILKDECGDLRLELVRKDELLRKNFEKLGYWQSILADLQSVTSVSGKTVGNPLAGSQTPGPLGQSQGQGPLTPGGGGRPLTPASVGRPQTPGGGGPLTPQGRMQPSPSLGFNPMGQGQGPPTGLQGPLAYLEKTASTIGMNSEQR